VDCWAVWCPPCRRATPTFEELALELSSTSSSSGGAGEILFFKANRDEVPEIMKLVGAEKIPFFVIYRDGKQVASMQNSKEEAIRSFFAEHIHPSSSSSQQPKHDGNSTAKPSDSSDDHSKIPGSQSSEGDKVVISKDEKEPG